MTNPMCTTYNNGEDVMFCDASAVITCWRFDGTAIHRVADPEVYHSEGAMTHWNDEPMLIAGVGVEVETYDGVQWNRQEDVPSVDPEYTYVEYHSAVNFKGDVYVFGGRPKLFHEIGAYRFNGSWSKIQNMAGFRYAHR